MEMIISQNQIFDDMSQLSILINHLNKTSVVESCLRGKGNLKIAIGAEKNIFLSFIFLLCHFVLSSLLQISFLLVTFRFYDPKREKYMASRLVLTASVSAPRLKCMTSLSVFTLTPFILKRFNFHSGVFLLTLVFLSLLPV